MRGVLHELISHEKTLSKSRRIYAGSTPIFQDEEMTQFHIFATILLMVVRYLSFIFLGFFLFTVSCQGGSTVTTDDTDDVTTSDVVNTAKLVGTPFEGLENADTLPPSTFLCGDRRTETIDELPIMVFAAFFTESEEEAIQEGIDLANNGAGTELYRLTDEWEETHRVIAKVSSYVSSGQTYTAGGYYNGNTISERQESDWYIIIESTSSMSKHLFAHELAHASGIVGHNLINYNTNSRESLETNSVMEATLPSLPIYDDYNLMMLEQIQIIEDNLITPPDNLRDCSSVENVSDSNFQELVGS
jgi:hypothetical protein